MGNTTRATVCSLHQKALDATEPQTQNVNFTFGKCFLIMFEKDLIVLLFQLLCHQSGHIIDTVSAINNKNSVEAS